MNELEEKSLAHKDNYKSQVLEFYKHIENLKDLDYLIHLIGFYSAPTINGLKIGSLINLKNTKRELINTWNENKKSIAEIFNLEFIELKSDKNSLLLYFYDNQRLKKKFENEQISSYLSGIGYEQNNNLNYYLMKLRENFQFSTPSEIGIFLDYPLLDVIDYNNKLKKCKYCGYWKCYNDVEGAKTTCQLYDISKMNYISKIINKKLPS
ncbi:DUF3793 family protein [Peptoniphilus olsenii]|uniref:DUF3793 family protein n=1 Tax=Peptoniphilus olsenii TaxID=411570 RepID=UPI003391522E